MIDHPVATEREAQIEGAKNLWRYNRRDIFNFSVLVVFALVVTLIGIALSHLLAVPPPHLYNHVAPVHLHHLKGFPIYHPPN